MGRTTTTKKRAAPSETSQPSKKARLDADPASDMDAPTLVNAILADTEAYHISVDEAATRQTLVVLAKYAKALEGQLAVSTAAAAAVVAKPKKTKEQIQEAAEKLRNVAVSGIQKQMSVSLRLVLSLESSC